MGSEQVNRKAEIIVKYELANANEKKGRVVL